MRSPFPLMNASAGLLVLGLLTAALPLRTAAADEVVGRFSNDWTGNGLEIQAIEDPKVKGITCHLVDFDRSLIDRLSKGNWFEDPSNASIACRQTGPVTVGDIELSQKGEEVFSERKSLIFKSIAIRRIYDRPNDTMVYVVYSRQVKDASAKTSISTVPLFSANATWTKGKPAAK
ncbi:CreA family protein [Azospirillum sp. A1-3]|uniref:CreA family protein n=1 Tax=unclassified Azospirillum TaxID=2630922 RepID=UPI0010AAD465|nr:MULTISPECIES: CreA family protein [unclassified Azospirillum]MCM8732973.1 CreA family protein [Azospirillum sp. A1-3]QCG98067.1 CREA protein [Azospirillum sp. TSA2s]